MLQQPAPRDAELRLALGMRGGVSLAVWIGGACAEIDELRRAADEAEAGFWRDLLELSPYKRVTVDVMAGASAGGLNGVLFAAAIRHGFRMDRLLRIWQDVADVGKLRRKEGPWSSLFDGDGRFLDVVRDKLTDLVDGDGLDEGAKDEQREVAQGQARKGYVDLQLSATLLEAVEQAAVSPGDEKLRRSRSTARFHFRHDPEAVPPRLEMERDDVPRLAVAARGTASFPVAFDAAMVRSSRPDRFRPRQEPLPEVQRVEDEPATTRDRLRLVECRGRFSESRGTARDGTELADDDFLVADGGAVDNIPLAKALDAARDAPADGPTRRVLVYLHPTGPTGIGRTAPAVGALADDRRSPARRNVLAVAKGLFASQIQSESIDGDLELLEAHNRTVRLGRVVRLGVLADLAHTEPEKRRAPSALAADRLGSYLNQRAVADAEEVRRLLADPLVVLGEDPFPVAPPAVVPDGGQPRHAVADDRWRSPMAAWGTEQRLLLDTSLRAAFTERNGRRDLGIDLMFGGIGPVQRSIDLLLELAREGEKQPGADAAALGEQKPPLYRLGSFVREVARVRRLGWVCCADRLEPDGDVPLWVDWTLEQLRLMLCYEDGLPSGLDNPASPDFDDAAAAFLGRCADDLQTLAAGGDLPSARGAEDLRDALVARLEVLAAPLLAGLPEVPTQGLVDAAEAERRSGAEVIQRVLSDPEAPSWEVRLAALEVLLVDEHLVGAPGRGEIGFTRMSAAAPIIHAARFTRLYEHSMAYDSAFTRDGHHLVPNVKLAGNELASFSAFLELDWRVNDWSWGRLDATASLVDLLLGEDRDDKLDVQAELDLAALREVAGEDAIRAATQGGGATDDLSVVRRALIARRQEELLAIATRPGRLPADLSKWQAGLETHVQPGSPRIAREVVELSSVAAHVVGDNLPRRVPRVIGPLQGVLQKAAQTFGRPRGGLPAVPGSQEARDAEAAKPESKGRYVGLAVASILVGLVLAGLAYAAADNAISLAIGLTVGLFVGLVPGAILLWLAVQPLKPDQVGRRYRTAAAVGVALGAGLVAIAYVVGRAVL